MGRRNVSHHLSRGNHDGARGDAVGIRDEERDRLECLKLAVILINAQKTSTHSDDVVIVAEKFYEFTRKDDRK
jgi:hypothetical protein